MHNTNKDLEISGISFGATSGVITALGLIIGLSATDSSKMAISTSILVLAFCDSLSDALGVQLSEESRMDEKGKSIFLASVFTFIGKFIFTSLFLLPILLLSTDESAYASIGLGFLILTIFSIFIAKRRNTNLIKELFDNLTLASIVLIASYLLGGLAERFK